MDYITLMICRVLRKIQLFLVELFRVLYLNFQASRGQYVRANLPTQGLAVIFVYINELEYVSIVYDQ